MSFGQYSALAEGTIRTSRISVTPLRCFGITFLNQDGVTRPRGWFALDMETRSKLLDVSKAELRFNGKSLKLIIDKLPIARAIGIGQAMSLHLAVNNAK